MNCIGALENLKKLNDVEEIVKYTEVAPAKANIECRWQERCQLGMLPTEDHENC